MRKNKRRDISVFSLSFLDSICCGFGAIILLFVLSKFSEPKIIQDVRVDLDSLIVKLEKEIVEIRGKTEIINQQLALKQDELVEAKVKLAKLQGDLSKIQGHFATSKDNAQVQNIVKGKLAAALQELTEEMKRLQQKKPPPPRKADTSVGGIPVDSEYIIFIIDTSGSMKRGAWGMVMKKLEETLKVYPKVRGIQVMNDDGIYMFPTYKGRWIPDTPGRRRVILSTMSTWQAFSNSSPVEGITEAIRRYYSPNKKISLYVFGDEFSGFAMQSVLDEVDRINKADRSGNRLVRIHGVGFPTMLEDPSGLGPTGIRFAALMRVLCERNGGTFVGLNTTRP